MLLITHNLGADALGIFALSSTLLNIASVIARLGVDGSLLRFAAEYSFCKDGTS
jgi:O-antigen/teichoic acid export membrane protein